MVFIFSMQILKVVFAIIFEEMSLEKKKELGCKTWTWESVLPFFNRVETDLRDGEEHQADPRL